MTAPSFVNPFTYANVQPDFLAGVLNVELAGRIGGAVVSVGNATFDEFQTREALPWMQRHNDGVWKDFQSRNAVQRARVEQERLRREGVSPADNVEGESSAAGDDDYATALNDNGAWRLDATIVEVLPEGATRPEPRIVATRLFNHYADRALAVAFSDPAKTAASQKADFYRPERVLGAVRAATGFFGKAELWLCYAVRDCKEGVAQDYLAVAVPLASLAVYLGAGAEYLKPEELILATAKRVRNDLFNSQVYVAGKPLRDYVQIGRADLTPKDELEAIEASPAEEDDGDIPLWEASELAGDSFFDRYDGLAAQAVIASRSSEDHAPPQRLIRVNLEEAGGELYARIIIERPRFAAYGPRLALQGGFRDWVAGLMRERTRVLPAISLEDFVSAPSGARPRLPRRI